MACTIDARGLACPQPVILAKNAVKMGEFPIEVLVDSTTSCDNVIRVARKDGCQVTVAADAKDKGSFRLVIEKSAS